MFGYHKINEEQAQVNNFIRRNIEDIANRFNEKLPDNEARNLALIKLKESLVWAIESNETNLETVIEHATVERNPLCRLCEREEQSPIHDGDSIFGEHKFQLPDGRCDVCGHPLCDICDEHDDSPIHNSALNPKDFHPFKKKV